MIKEVDAALAREFRIALALSEDTFAWVIAGEDPSQQGLFSMPESWLELENQIVTFVHNEEAIASALVTNASIDFIVPSDTELFHIKDTDPNLRGKSPLPGTDFAVLFTNITPPQGV